MGRKRAKMKPNEAFKGVYRGKIGKNFILTLAIGISFGFSFAYILLSSSFLNFNWIHFKSFQDSAFRDMENVPNSELSSVLDLHEGEDDVAKELTKKVRVLCWIMTTPKNHKSKARHVKATWGRRCNILLFMSSENDTSLPSVKLPVQEGRDYLWAKTKEAFKYVYKHYLNQADWFYKADDDTYAVMENMRYMLSNYNSSEPLYFGCRFKTFVKQGYMSGGAGYVLSREAVRLFVERAIPNMWCRQDDHGAEDVEIGKCLEHAGVKAMDSRDSLGRGRFFPFVPEHVLIPGFTGKDFWYWQYIYYETKEGIECCSDSAISFHYIPPNMMYVLDYLVYHLRPYGINHQPHDINTSKKLKIMKHQESSPSASEVSLP